MNALLIAVAITTAIHHSFLMKYVLKLPSILQELVTCPLCLGFHVGWATALFFNAGWHAPEHGVFSGVGALVLSRVLHALAAVTEYYQTKTSKLLSE